MDYYDATFTTEEAITSVCRWIEASSNDKPLIRQYCTSYFARHLAPDRELLAEWIALYPTMTPGLQSEFKFWIKESKHIDAVV